MTGVPLVVTTADVNRHDLVSPAGRVAPDETARAGTELPVRIASPCKSHPVWLRLATGGSRAL